MRGKKLQLTDVWFFFPEICILYGRHLLAKSVYHERSPYIIEIALEFAVIGKIKLHDFIHIRSVFVLFACSLSLDFMKAGWKTGGLYWLLVSCLVFMAFNAWTPLLTPPLEAGWLAEFIRRSQPLFFAEETHHFGAVFLMFLGGFPWFNVTNFPKSV